METLPPDPDNRPLPGQHGVQAGSVHLLAQPIGGLVRAGDLERREVIYASASTKREELRLLGANEPTEARSMQEGSCSEGHGVGGHRGRKMSPRLLVRGTRHRGHVPGDAEEGDVAGRPCTGNQERVLVSTGRSAGARHTRGHWSS